jgi:hypothetical protein
MREIIDMAGYFSLALIDHSGRTVAERKKKNRIVKTGRNLVAQLFAGPSGPPMAIVSHMGVGGDNTVPSDDDTDLLAPRSPRKPFTVEYTDFDEVTEEGTIKRQRTRLTAEFDFSEANDPLVPLTEAAIFNDVSAGVMYNRVVFEGVTKTDAFKLTLQWDIIF